VFVFLAIRTIYQSDSLALLAALLDVSLLPTLVFGAIPESFALSGCTFAALFYLASRTAVGRPLHVGWWVVVGIALSSWTLTNVWLFALVYAVVHSQPRWLTLRAGLDAVRLSAIVLVGTAAIALVVGYGYGALADYRTTLPQLADLRAPRPGGEDRRWTDVARAGAGLAAAGAFQIFPKALGHTILPPPASIQGATRGLTRVADSDSERPEPSLHANYRYTPADWGTFVALAALAGAVLAATTSRGPQRPVHRLAVALIAANWGFHAVFGVEMFLYSKHWSVAVAMALTAWLDVKRPIPLVGVGVLVLLLLLAVLRDVQMLTHLVRTLSGS
jgi:hypothetical protein